VVINQRKGDDMTKMERQSLLCRRANSFQKSCIGFGEKSISLTNNFPEKDFRIICWKTVWAKKAFVFEYACR